MSDISQGRSPNATARFAGLLYVLLTPLGILGIMYVPSALVVPGDILVSIANIEASELLFRTSIAVALLVQLVHIYLVILLYKILRPVNEAIAQIMLLLVMVGVPIAMLNELNHGAVLLVLGMENGSIEMVSVFLDLHAYGIQVVGVFWGLWLFPFGYLVFKSGFLPKLIGILLMIGCFGYVADAFIYILNPNFGISFAEYLFVGELVIALWLLIKGVDVAKWGKLNQELAQE